MDNTSSPPNCTSPTELDLCASSIHVGCLAVIGTFALIANIILGYATHCIWTQNKSPDKILIFNLVASSLVMLASIPLQCSTIRNLDRYLACDSVTNTFYTSRLVVLFGANFATLATLAMIGYDRYEALTKFPTQRKLTISRSYLLIAFAWGMSVFLATLLFYGPTKTTCARICLQQDLSLVPENQNADVSRVVIIALYIAFCCNCTIASLLKATWTVRAHRQQIEALYGVVRAQAEVDFTKVCGAIILTYILTWLPSGISIIVISQSPNLVSLCAYFWSNSLSFTSALLLPIIYIKMDKRLWSGVRDRHRGNSVDMAPP